MFSFGAWIGRWNEKSHEEGPKAARRHGSFVYSEKSSVRCRKSSCGRFLTFAVSPEENAQRACSMEACEDLLKRANSIGFTTFPEGIQNKEKVVLLLSEFNSLNDHAVLSPLVLSWMHEAVQDSFFTLPDAPMSSLPIKPDQDAAAQAQDSPDSKESSVSSISNSTTSSHGLLLGTGIHEHNDDEASLRYSFTESSEDEYVNSFTYDPGEVQKFGVVGFLSDSTIQNFLDGLNLNWDFLGYDDMTEMAVKKIVTAIRGLQLHESHNQFRESVLESFEQQYENDARGKIAFLHLAFERNTTSAVMNDSRITSSHGGGSVATAATGQSDP